MRFMILEFHPSTAAGAAVVAVAWRGRRRGRKVVPQNALWTYLSLSTSLRKLNRLHRQLHWPPMAVRKTHKFLTGSERTLTRNHMHDRTKWRVLLWPPSKYLFPSQLDSSIMYILIANNWTSSRELLYIYSETLLSDTVVVVSMSISSDGAAAKNLLPWLPRVRRHAGTLTPIDDSYVSFGVVMKVRNYFTLWVIRR